MFARYYYACAESMAIAVAFTGPSSLAISERLSNGRPRNAPRAHGARNFRTTW